MIEGCDIVLGAASLMKVIAALEVIGKALITIAVIMFVNGIGGLYLRRRR